MQFYCTFSVIAYFPFTKISFLLYDYSLYDFRHSLSIHIPFPQCAEKISSPPVKPLGVGLNKLDYPLMSAYSVMNTGTRTPPALCHSHYSYTGQNYFDINLVGDRVN